MRHITGLLAFFLLALDPVASQAPVFTPNEGQWDPRVEYRADLQGGKCYLEAQGFTYLLHDFSRIHDRQHQRAGKDDKDHEAVRVNAHSIKVRFPGSTKPSDIGARGPSDHHVNYFLSDDQREWATGLHKYRQVRYKRIHEGIDMVVESKDEGVKYEFHVAPGTDPDTLKMVYKGASSLEIRDGQLRIETSLGPVIEKAPVAFQGKEKERIPCRFELQGDTVSFVFPEGHDQNQPLVIDPDVVFATYSGSNSDNWGNTATYDEEGNFYGGGTVFGPDFPSTTGAFQVDIGGGEGNWGCDMSIKKFDENGTDLRYATFLGGSRNEVPQSMITDDQGNLFLIGATGSPDFPTTSDAYQSDFGGGTQTSFSVISFDKGSDLAVAKLSIDGTTLLGGTFFGGSGNDGLNGSGTLNYNYGDILRGEVILTGNGRCVVTSSTRSADLPTDSLSAQSDLVGGQDAFVASFSPDLKTREWSTYLGSPGDDAGYSVKPANNGDLYITGGTDSSAFPILNGWQTQPKGGSDGYVVRMSSNGSQFKNGTLLSTENYDQSYLLDQDTAGNILVYGQSTGPYPVNTNGYMNDSSGQFIQKLPPTLNSSLMSTVFGTGSGQVDISPSAFMVSNCNNIYLSGWGGASNKVQSSTTNGLPVTGDAYQSQTDGSDFYLMVLGEDASTLKYATFFGGDQSSEHVDGGTSRFDDDGVVYQGVCGGCGGNSDFPTTDSAWSATNESSNCNYAAIKFDLSQLNAIIDLKDPPFTCTPDTFSFDASGADATKYRWDLGDGTTATGPSVDHYYEDTGTYTVTLIVSDTLTCLQKDTATMEVGIYPPIEPYVDSVDPICEGDSVQINAGNGFNFHWGPVEHLDDPFKEDPVAFPDSTTTFTGVASGCASDSSLITDTLSVTVPVNHIVSGAHGDTTVCAADSATLHATGEEHTWTPPNGLNDPSAPHPKAAPLDTTTYQVTIIDSNGCKTKDSVTVNVLNLDSLKAGPDTLICRGDTVQLTATGAKNYEWSPKTGLDDPYVSDPMASPSDTTRYVVKDKDCGIVPDSVWIGVQSPDAKAGPDTTVCPGDTVLLKGSGGTAYTWTPPKDLSYPDSSTTWAYPDKTRGYELIVEDDLGCTSVASALVETFPDPGLDAGPDRELEYGTEFTLDADGAPGDYRWQPEDALPKTEGRRISLFAREHQTYSVTMTDSNGCRYTDSLRVLVSGALYAPNAFTPNGDGDNDVFRIKGEYIEDFHLWIYDRWGELVYETRNIEDSWDGTRNGNPLKSDVYIWKVRYTEEWKPRIIKEKTGHVTLIR